MFATPILPNIIANLTYLQHITIRIAKLVYNLVGGATNTKIFNSEVLTISCGLLNTTLKVKKLIV